MLLVFDDSARVGEWKSKKSETIKKKEALE
jgi:hypothetical protein